MYNAQLFARLVYILHSTSGMTIPKELFRYLPGGEWMSKFIEGGIGASGVNPEILSAVIDEGARLGPGDAQEGCILVQRLVDQYLKDDTKIEIGQRLKIYRTLFGLKAIMSEQTVEIDMSDPGDIEQMPKFETGFQPLDAATGGFYQGIFLLMGPPGSGKTSIMISLMETIRDNKHNGSILFVQNEISASMMRYRMHPVLKRTKFLSGDKTICGPLNAHHILDWVRDHPDPDRIILFDGPDVVIGGDTSQGSKAFIADEYITLIELKSLCKSIIVSGWPNRKNNTVQHFNDVGDAIEKARYADCIVGINPLANEMRQLIGLKNRFGPPNIDLTFQMDMEKLTWDPGSVRTESDFWEALQNDQGVEANGNGRV